MGNGTDRGRQTGAAQGLTLDDVLDLRAYERAREGYRRQIIAHKRLRRVPLGRLMTVVFESFDTVRFQVHEMARAERMMTDEAIQEELDVYNRLLPSPGELSATLLIELTNEEDLRHWLPRLVGIERSLGIEGGGGGGRVLSRAVPEGSHAGALTREEVTPAVHYLRFPFAPADADALAAGPAALVADHPAYQERTPLADETRAELVADLSGEGEPLPLA